MPIPRSMLDYAGQRHGNPVQWIRDLLGADPWEKQRDILYSVRDHQRTAVRSCHGVGKTKTAAWCALWFLHCHPGGKVITTAPTWHQVENLLWREIRTEHAKAKMPLGSQILQTRCEVDTDWYAIGLSTDTPERFQGYHGTHLLLIVDEASGVPQDIFDASEGFMTSAGSKSLLIGNPNNLSGEFHAAFHGQMYHQIHISCYDTPNFQGSMTRPYLITPEWVDEKKAQWGEDSPLFQIKCLGEFPSNPVDTVIPLAWIRRAASVIRHRERPRRIMAVDVARFGDDRTVCYYLEETDIRDAMVWNQKDTMHTAGMVHIWAQEKSPDLIGVDTVGLGAGVADRLREMGNPVEDVNSSERAADTGMFRNLRSEMWWNARQMFQDSDIQLTWRDDELMNELSTPQYAIYNGKVQVEGKDDIKKRLRASPDKADAYIIGLHTLHKATLRDVADCYEQRALDEMRLKVGRYSGL